MTGFLRFGGAQIPCTPDIDKNVETIKKSIDWAAENNVEYLVTPEASLSGYTAHFADDLDKLKKALTDIEKYASDKRVGLCLGTLWVENEDDKPVKRNQIRFYNKYGFLIGCTNKTMITPYDFDIGIKPNEYFNSTYLEFEDDGNKSFLHVVGFICMDLYGRDGMPSLTKAPNSSRAAMFIHSTNAMRDVGPIYDSVMSDHNDATLRCVSYVSSMPVITVDNCYRMEGTEWDGPTSSQCGVLIGGEWMVRAPRHGTQHFFYDFPIDNLKSKDWPNGPGKN